MMTTMTTTATEEEVEGTGEGLTAGHQDGGEGESLSNLTLCLVGCYIVCINRRSRSRSRSVSGRRDIRRSQFKYVLL